MARPLLGKRLGRSRQGVALSRKDAWAWMQALRTASPTGASRFAPPRAKGIPQRVENLQEQ